MSAKRLWTYLGFLGLVAAVWAVVYFLFPAREGEEKNPPLFGRVEENQIQTIVLERSTETLDLKKNKEWEITRPIQARADRWTVDSILRTLSGLTAERRYTEKNWQNQEFGLYPPRLKIRFEVQGKKHELWVGNRNPTGTYYYAKIPSSPDLLLIYDYQIQDLDRSLFDIRDKRVFSFPLDRIQTVEVKTPTKTFVLEKDKEGWKAKADPPLKLNTTPVENFLNDLLDLKVQSFLGEEREDPRWGLREPSHVIRLVSSDQPPGEERLHLGKEVSGKGIYARSTLQKEVFFLHPNILKKIPTDLEGWKYVPPPPAEKKGS